MMYKVDDRHYEEHEYTAWLEDNYDDLSDECAESGAWDELDFDFDEFTERRFDERV